MCACESVCDAHRFQFHQRHSLPFDRSLSDVRWWESVHSPLICSYNYLKMLLRLLLPFPEIERNKWNDKFPNSNEIMLCVRFDWCLFLFSVDFRLNTDHTDAWKVQSHTELNSVIWLLILQKARAHVRYASNFIEKKIMWTSAQHLRRLHRWQNRLIIIDLYTHRQNYFIIIDMIYMVCCRCRASCMLWGNEKPHL